MNNVGIITFHNAWNNGAYLQAYAMLNFLKDSGFDAKIVETNIKFNPFKSDSNLTNIWWRNYEQKLLSCQKYLTKSLNKESDVIIYGSDEIWNIASYGSNPIFWGYGLKARRKIAYSPSAGGCGLLFFIKHPFKTLMVTWAINHNFISLSARDNATKKIINHFTNKKVKECLDPTFLYDFSKYKGENKYGDYIVVYSYGLKKQTIEMIKDYAKKHCYKIYYTGSYCDWSEENPILNPFEWLNLMYHAKYVFTSTFHGTVFAILCERQFSVVDTNSNKVMDILKKFKISDRIINGTVENIKTIDYSKVNKLKNILILNSKEYLWKNINRDIRKVK